MRSEGSFDFTATESVEHDSAHLSMGRLAPGMKVRTEVVNNGIEPEPRTEMMVIMVMQVERTSRIRDSEQ